MQLTQYQKDLAESVGVWKEEHMEKAATPIEIATFSGNGGLSQDLADAFIDLVRDESVLMRSIRIHRTQSRSGEMSKLDVVGYVTEQASENATSTETRAPVNTSVPFATAKTRSQFDITGEVEEDNIEGSGGKNTILNTLVKHIRNDMETLSIEGDESVAGSSDFQRLVKTNDGFNVIASAVNGSHIQAVAGQRVSWILCKQMLMKLPTRYRTDRSQLRWIMSANTVLELQGEAEARATGLGDLMWSANGGPPAPLGIPILEVPKIPENLTISGTDSTGTFIMLCDPQNLVMVVQRDLVVHDEFRPRTDKTEVTAFMRTDFVVENNDAIVKATGVSLDPSASRVA